jgi:DNA invertase Pin-like site-specific DNA recombinase
MKIGYMRVSTDLDRQSFDLQFDALIKAGVDERNIFKDAQSGASTKRQGLEQALEYMKAGDCLVVWKLDRLGRSLVNLIDIMQKLRDKKIGFQSLTEAFDTTTAQGDLFFHLMASLSQYERALLKERINAGLAAVRSRGRVGGRPKAIDSEKWAQIEKSLADGTSKVSICRTFGVKRSTLYGYLIKNNCPTYSDCQNP